MFHIRPLLSKDSGPLAIVAHRIFVDTFLPMNNPQDVIDYADAYLTPSAFLKELESSQYFTFGVFNENELIGYMQMVFNSQEIYEGCSLELKRFYLLSHYHGHGLAPKMMDVCVEKARDLGQKGFWLGVWEKNDRAQKFYTKMGFKKVASHPFVMGSETQTDDIFIKYLEPKRF